MIWKRALQNTTATRFARVNYLHSERHKPHPGQALASRDVVAIKNKKKTPNTKPGPGTSSLSLIPFLRVTILPCSPFIGVQHS